MSISGLIIIAIVIVLVIILWSLLAVRGSGYNASKEGLFLTNEDVPNRDINSKPNDVQYDNVDAEVERQHTVLDDDDLGFINSAIYGCICDDVPHEDTIPNNVQYDHNIEAKVEKQHPILDHNSAVFQINIRYLKGKGSPLIIDSSTGALLLPDRAGSSVITMVPGTHFQVGCPGSKIKIDENTTIVGKVDAVALSGSLVSISGRTADLYKIKCSKRIASVARPTGSSCFGNLGEEIEIGFLFPDGHFIRVMTTCFDPVTRKTYYALSTLSKHIKEKNTGRTKAWWTEDKLYHKKNQMATFNRLVGLPKNSTKYVQLNGKFYLARGHLAAKSDFMYFAEQEATLNYNNAVPQWQTLNSSNWFKLETGIRKYAAESGLDLLIMTGPYGISTLPHEQNGLPVELYLFVEGNDRAIPVPELIWKVVYSQSTQRGVAFLAINNPYLVDIQQSIIYPDIADQLNWLSLDRTILSNGFRIASLGLNGSRGLPFSDDEVPLEDFKNLYINNVHYFDNIQSEVKKQHTILENVYFGLTASVCQINIRDLPQRKPLLRNPSTQAILLPDSAGSSVITIAAGRHFEIDCPGSNIVVDATLTIGEIADAVCVSGNRVAILGRTVDFSTVVCSRRIASVARYTGQNCFGNLGRETEVGFVFTDGHFIREMTTCFDPVTRNVYYSLFDLSHQIGDQNTGGTRPGWTEGVFYNLGIRLDNLYPNVAQRVTINRLVGLPDDSNKYVLPTGNYYLARGHLTARSDYIYDAQQEATFHYVNSVPQWQSFNGFNWAYLERNVRQYAARTGLDLVVMTGPYGISTLPHEKNGLPVELYLFAEGSGRAMPVPELFWKVVYSPSTQRGIAILGINNPYLSNIQPSIICPDIAGQLNWLSFDRTILTRGYIYACTIPELRRIIPQIPNYRVNGILN